MRVALAWGRECDLQRLLVSTVLHSISGAIKFGGICNSLISVYDSNEAGCGGQKAQI